MFGGFWDNQEGLQSFEQFGNRGLYNFCWLSKVLSGTLHGAIEGSGHGVGGVGGRSMLLGTMAPKWALGLPLGAVVGLSFRVARSGGARGFWWQGPQQCWG